MDVVETRQTSPLLVLPPIMTAPLKDQCPHLSTTDHVFSELVRCELPEGHADDKPWSDPGRVHVSGPWTWRVSARVLGKRP